MLEILSFILNAILSGGLVVTLVTLKSVKVKAHNEAKGVEIDNAQKLLDNFDTFIVQPLKSDVNELRKSVYRLQTAIKQIPACPHADTCPVTNKLDELQHPTLESTSKSTSKSDIESESKSESKFD